MEFLENPLSWLDFAQSAVLGWFVELSLWPALIAVTAFVLVFACLAGFALSYFSGRVGLIRMISAIIATISIVFFAFEKRDALVENTYTSQAKRAASVLSSAKDWASFQRDANCRTLTLAQALSDAAPIETIGRRGALCTVMAEISMRLEAASVSDSAHREKLRESIGEASHALFPEDAPIELSDFVTRLDEIDGSAKDLLAAERNRTESRQFSRYLGLFIVLFAAGAGLEIGNENRVWFAALRRWISNALRNAWAGLRRRDPDDPDRNNNDKSQT